MKCIKVGLKQAEVTKRRLMDLEIFDRNYKVKREGKHVYFPITKAVKDFTIVNKTLERSKNKITFEDLLKDKLSKKELELVTKAYDIVGDIVILGIDRELLDKKKIIAKALLESNKTLKTVVRKIGEHKGKYRIRDYELLVGKNNFETLYRESGVVLRLDIRKAYFSIRLSTERLRIAKLVKPGESVLVMFSGINPYGLVIAKNSKAKEICSVEINKDACRYAEENSKLNKVNNVKLFCGDVREVVPKLNKKFDRVVMAFPINNKEFLDVALSTLKKNGIVHFYCFSGEDRIRLVAGRLRKLYGVKILKIVKCGQSKPREYRYCVDFKVLD